MASVPVGRGIVSCDQHLGKSLRYFFEVEEISQAVILPTAEDITVACGSGDVCQLRAEWYVGLIGNSDESVA